MKKIPLSQGKFALVDEEDYGLLSESNWFAFKDGNHWYARRNLWLGRHNVRKKATTIKMHRQIMGFPDCDIDHINHDGLDNQRQNLRLATRSQNLANSELSICNKSGYKGVSWDRVKWRSSIVVNYQQVQLGRFDELSDAISAYKSAAEERFGVFANAATR